MHPLLKVAAAKKGARENGGSSVVNVSSVAGLTAVNAGERAVCRGVRVTETYTVQYEDLSFGA